ncbi:MAG: hypothetical protein LBR48_04195 [Dysgonamonadaceae bacterium]|jgi:hypothetical protein|nr:hypothetical protein [Dysgonamonadaceae bacterium]
MKIKTFFLTALAASMIFVSCSKDEQQQSPTDTALKTVQVSLANLTRGYQDPVATGDKATLNNFQIFFVDASGAFYNGYAATDLTKTTPLETYFSLVSDIPSTYHYIDANVTKVIVVANYGSKITTAANETALKALSTVIVNQQNVANLWMIGEAALVSGGTDDAGHTSNIYTANVSVVPLVARIEVGAFQYNEYDPDGTGPEPAGRKYEELALTQLAINNYGGTSTLAPAVSGGVSATINNTTVFTFLDGLISGWYTDALSVTMDGTESPTAWLHDEEDANGKVWAYNVFPQSGVVPQLILRLTGTLPAVPPATTGVTEALYLATSALTGYTAQRGYVYKMTVDSNTPFAFDDDDLENPEKCVVVSVTVTPWTVVAVTPVF